MREEETETEKKRDREREGESEAGKERGCNCMQHAHRTPARCLNLCLSNYFPCLRPRVLTLASDCRSSCKHSAALEEALTGDGAAAARLAVAGEASLGAIACLLAVAGGGDGSGSC